MQKWYYLVKGQKQGPVDADHITSLASTGIIAGETPIRPESSNDWVEFRNSDLAQTATPCQTINSIGRLNRTWRDLRLSLAMSFVFLFPICLRGVLDFISLPNGAPIGKHELWREMIRFAMESRFWLVIVVLGSVFLLAALLLWALQLYRMWQVIPRRARSIHPALAAILSAVPVVSLAANFWTVAGLCRALTRQERSEGVVARRPSLALGLAFCILAILAFALPHVVILVLFPIWGGVARQLHDAAANILHQRLLE